MAEIGTLEASIKSGYSRETIRKWCRNGKIKGATQDKFRSSWHIPVNFMEENNIKKKQ